MTEVETQSTALPSTLPPTSLSKTRVSMFHCFVTVGVPLSNTTLCPTIRIYRCFTIISLNSGHSSVTVSSNHTAAGRQQSLGKISPPRSCQLTPDSVPNKIDGLILPPVSGRGHPFITSAGLHRCCVWAVSPLIPVIHLLTAAPAVNISIYLQMGCSHL